jgi:heme exporter protein D
MAIGAVVTVAALFVLSVVDGGGLERVLAQHEREERQRSAKDGQP